MKRNEMAFTLIELLAVIIILAIIAVITIPAMISVIEEARISSYVRSSEGIVHATENYYNQYKLGNVDDIQGNLYEEVMNNVSGEKPESGEIYVDKNGHVAFAFDYDGYCLHKNYKTNEIHYEKTDGCQYPMDYLQVSDNTKVAFLKGNLPRNKFESIATIDSNEVPDGNTTGWDVSERQNGSVMAWYTDVDNDELYELYIGQDGGVIANPNSYKLFAYFSNVTSIDLDNFYTSHVTNMRSMFYELYNLKILNISHLDTSSVKDMSTMFFDVRSLENLDISNFDTSKVENMRHIFDGMESLKTLDVSNFDTSNVEDMAYMFRNLKSLTYLDASNLDTTNVIDMKQIFCNLGVNNGLDMLKINSFIFDNVSIYQDMFLYSTINNIEVGSIDNKTWIESRLSEANKTANVTVVPVQNS